MDMHGDAEATMVGGPVLMLSTPSCLKAIGDHSARHRQNPPPPRYLHFPSFIMALRKDGLRTNHLPVIMVCDSSLIYDRPLLNASL